MKALALCHDIVIDTATGDYNAASPDELALVNFAKQVGIQFIGHDDSDNMVIDVGEGEHEKYKLWHVCDFNSSRKRMSVIVEDQDGTIKLICKGADSIIAERLSKESLESSIYRKTQKVVDKYANEGLRTLFVAERIIPRDEFDQWFKYVKEHKVLTSGREKALAEDNEKIERDMTLIGSTAIEDRLQDEVGDTIRFMKRTGIKVWVLTGDKVGTAINIGFSAGLLDSNMDQYLVDGKESSIKAQLDEANTKISAAIQKKGHRKQAIIVAGDSLTEIAANDGMLK